MTWLPAGFVKRALAVSILVLLAGSAVSLVMQTIVELPRSRSAEIANLEEQLAELRAGTGREATLRQRQATVSAALQSLSAFWAGPSRTQIAAAMQDVLRSATQQAGGQIVSTSVLEGDHAGDTLSVRARVDGTLATLQHVLTTIETVRPRLFVDSLVVTTLSESTPAQPQQLSFELSTSGYLTTGSLATR